MAAAPTAQAIPEGREGRIMQASSHEATFTGVDWMSDTEARPTPFA
jgi:hypothetical protein